MGGDRVIKQDGKTYRQDWKGDWVAETDWLGNERVDRDWRGNPKIERDWRGDQKIVTDWRGNPVIPPEGSTTSSGGYGGGCSGGGSSGDYSSGGYGGGYVGETVRSTNIRTGTFLKWVLVGALSGLIPTFFAADYTWGHGDHPGYLAALRALAIIGMATGLVSCAIGLFGKLTTTRLSSAIVRGAVAGTIATVVVNSCLNWQYAHSHAGGHLHFPLAVWLIFPGFVIGWVVVAGLRNRSS